MKKYILLLLIIGASFYFHHSSSDKNAKILRIGVECDHPPYNWQEKLSSSSNFPIKNNPGVFVEGYDVQMAALLAKEIGAKAEFYQVEFNDLIDSLLNGEIDAIFSGMVDTEERKKRINFTEPYEVTKVEYVIVVNTRSAYRYATRVKDFKRARIIAQKDSRFDEVIDQIPEVQHLPPLDTQSAVFSEVLSYNADGTVVNYDTGTSYASRHRNLKLIRFSENEGFNLGFTGLCAGVRKTDLKLLSQLNKAIESISQRERQKVMDDVIKILWSH